MLCLLAVGVVAIGQQRVPARKIREGEFSNAESVETKFPALSRRICHQADSSTVVRRFFRGTASLYIFSILFSRKSRVQRDAAFSYLFLFIPRLLFCAAGITSSARIHLYLALFHHRDYFFRPDSSLSCSFVLQGLFLLLRCIPSLLFCAAGIISSAQMHPQLAFLCRRDYFFCSDASPACFFLPQGLLLPPGFISSLLFCAAGITFSARIHPYLALFLRRDYCDRSDSSLSCSFSPQGLFLPPGFILILLFFTAGMISSARIHPQLAFFTAEIISSARIHPYLALFFRRDDFFCADASLSCSFPPQGLLRPPGFISILLFFSTGIIANARIHLYLALFHRRDYF